MPARSSQRHKKKSSVLHRKHGRRSTELSAKDQGFVRSLHRKLQELLAPLFTPRGTPSLFPHHPSLVIWRFRAINPTLSAPSSKPKVPSALFQCAPAALQPLGRAVPTWDRFAEVVRCGYTWTNHTQTACKATSPGEEKNQTPRDWYKSNHEENVHNYINQYAELPFMCTGQFDYYNFLNNWNSSSFGRLFTITQF